MPGVFPTVIFSCAFASNPMSTPTWVNISTRARAFGSKRGRQFELDRVQTGTASVRLSNQDRALDPNNAASTYYPNVVPMRRFKVEATWNSITYPVFLGFVEDWPQTWGENGRLAETTVAVVDGFAVFGYGTLNSTYPAQLSGARINAVLDDLVWGSGQPGILDDPVLGLLDSTMILGPVGDRSIATGAASLQGVTLNSTFALEHLQSVAESENGTFFIGRDGSATFLSRFNSATSAATFGDSTGELPYADLELASTPIWNDVRLTAVGGVEQSAADSSSQTRYFKRSKVESGFLQAADLDVRALADYIVAVYKQPTVRVTSIVIEPQKDPNNLWPQVLGREIGDHVTINRRPPGGGVMISQESVIEGIEHTATPYRWTTRFWLSAATTSDFFILDSATLGILNTNMLGY